MARLLLLTIAVVATAATATAWFDAGTVQDELIVKYNIVPDPFHKSNFIKMPRNAYDALFEEKIPFDIIDHRPQDGTKVFCRGTDYRVCLLFDRWDSVAGIRLSVKQSDMERSGFDLSDVPEWELNWNRAAGENVYSATVFFLSKEDLLEGRRLRPGGLTAPDGIWILQTDKNGTEINRLHVPNEQSQATSAGFTEQACFFGMGKHYFQELSKDGTCENHRPYFMLYGPESKTLNGFGFVQYGKVTTDSSTGRQSWFESPPAKVAKMIAPNSPDCLEDWVNEKGLFTMHVYFVSSPYFTRC